MAALIEVSNLRKIYNEGGMETSALRGVSFSMNAGDFLAIMGASGSGKSTLLHSLGFLDRPTAGEYRFDGKTINDYSDEEIARARNKKMGFVFQAFNLLPKMSVLENVKLPLFYSGVKESLWNDMAMKAVASVGLSHRAHHDSSQLSGGEKQRAAIARALVNNPQVIFADEPTGNLDSESSRTVMEIIRGLNEKEGRTIVLITHEAFSAEHAARIIRLHDGKIESDRRPDHSHRLKADQFQK